MVVATNLWRSLPAKNEGPEGYRQAAFRLRNDRSVNSAAIFMRLLASTAAATHSSNRSRPSARQRFTLWDAHHLDAILFARRHVVLAEEPAIASIQVGSVAEGLLVAF